MRDSTGSWRAAADRGTRRRKRRRAPLAPWVRRHGVRVRPTHEDALRTVLAPLLALALLVVAAATTRGCTSPIADTIAPARLVDGSPVVAIDADPGADRLWIAQEEGGLSRVAPDTFLVERVRPDGEGAHGLLDLAVPREDRVLLLHREPGRGVTLTGEGEDATALVGGGRIEGLHAGAVRQAAAFGNTLFLLLDDGTLAEYDRERRTLRDWQLDPALPGRVDSMVLASDGSLLLASQGRILRLSRSGEGWRASPSAIRVPGRVQQLLATGNDLLARTREGALFRIDLEGRGVEHVVAGGTWPALSLDDVAWFDAAEETAVLLDRKGEIGRYDYDTGLWRHARLPAAVLEGTEPLHDRRTGDVMVALAGGGRVRIPLDTWEAGRFRVEDREWEFLCFAPGPDGPVEVLRRGDIRLVREGGVEQLRSDPGQGLDSPWIGTLRGEPGDPGAGIGSLYFVGASGTLLPYDMSDKGRSFAPEAWQVAGESTWRRIDRAVDGRERALFGVDERGRLHRIRHWMDAEERTLPTQVLVDDHHPPAAAPAVTASVGEDLLLVFDDGATWRYHLDDGWTKLDREVLPASLRRVGDSGLLARDRKGDLFRLENRTWRAVPLGETRVARLGSGGSFVPVVCDDGSVRLVGAAPHPVREWLPPSPRGPHALRPPFSDALHRETGDGLWVADARGVVVYSLDTRTWTRVLDDPAPDRILEPAAGNVLAFSASARRVHVLRPGESRPLSTVEGVAAVRALGGRLALLRDDGSVQVREPDGATVLTLVDAPRGQASTSAPCLQMAVFGNEVLMLARDGSLLRYRPGAGTVSRAAVPSPGPFAMLRSGGRGTERTVALYSRAGALLLHRGSGPWSRVAVPGERLRDMVVLDTGSVLVEQEGGVVRLVEQGVPRVLLGTARPGESPGRPLHVHAGRRGLWLVGTRGVARWDADARSLEPRSFEALRALRWTAIDGALFVQSADRIFRLAADATRAAVHELSGPAVLAAGGDVARVFAGDRGVVEIDAHGRLRDTGLLAPAGHALRGGLTAVAPTDRGVLIGTGTGDVFSYDARRRSPRRLSAGMRAGAVERIVSREDGPLVLRRASDAAGLVASVLSPGGRESDPFGPLADVAWAGGQAALLHRDGSLAFLDGARVVGHSAASEPSRPTPVHRAWPAGDSLWLQTAQGELLHYGARSARSEARLRTANPELFPLQPLGGGGFAVLDAGGRRRIHVLEPREGRMRTAGRLDSSPVDAWVGDGTRVSTRTTGRYSLLDAGGTLAHHFEPARGVRPPGSFPDACAPDDGSRIHLLSSDPQAPGLWSYEPRTATWGSTGTAPPAQGLRIVAHEGEPNALVSSSVLFDPARGVSESIDGWPVVVPGQGILAIGSDASLVHKAWGRRPGVAWHPHRGRPDQTLRYAFSHGGATFARLDRGALVARGGEWRAVYPPHRPAAELPDRVVETPEAVFWKAGRHIWSFDGERPRREHDHASRLLVASGRTALAEDEQGALWRLRGGSPREVLPEAAPAEHAPPVGARIHHDAARGEYVVHADGRLHWRAVLDPRGAWRSAAAPLAPDAEPEPDLARVGGRLVLRARTPDGFHEDLLARTGPDARRILRVSRSGTSVTAEGAVEFRIPLAVGDVAPDALLQDSATGVFVRMRGDGPPAFLQGERWDPVPILGTLRQDAAGLVWIGEGAAALSLTRLLAGPARGEVAPVAESDGALWTVDGGWPRRMEAADVAEASAVWRAADGRMALALPERGCFLVEEDPDGFLRLGPRERFPRGRLAALSVRHLRRLASLDAPAVRIGRDEVWLDVGDAWAVFRRGADRAELATEPPPAPADALQVTGSVARGGMPGDEVEVEATLDADGAPVLRWGGCVAGWADGAWRAVSAWPTSARAPADYRPPPDLEAGRASFPVAGPAGRPVTFDARWGGLVRDRLVRLERDGERVIGVFADGSRREWSAGREWVATTRRGVSPAAKAPFDQLGDAVRRTESGLDVLVDGVRVPLVARPRAGGFACDLVAGHAPADRGVYLRSSACLWLARDGARTPVRDARGRAVAAARIELARTDEDRFVLAAVDAGGAPVVLLGRDAVAPSGPLRRVADPLEGARIWEAGGIRVERTGGRPTEFAFRVEGEWRPTAFRGRCFAHDRLNGVVYRDGRPFVRSVLGAEREADPGGGWRGPWRNVGDYAKEPPPVEVSLPGSPLGFERTAGGYRLFAAAQGRSRVPIPVVGTRFECDVPVRMAAAGDTLATASRPGILLHRAGGTGTHAFLPWPAEVPVESVTEIAFDRDNRLWLLANRIPLFWDGGWRPGAAGDSPFRAVARAFSRAADGLAEFSVTGAADDPLAPRFLWGAGGRRWLAEFDAERGNFRHALAADGGARALVDASGLVHLRTAAGSLRLGDAAATGAAPLVPSGSAAGPEPRGPDERAVAGSDLVVRSRAAEPGARASGPEELLAWAAAPRRLAPVDTRVRDGRMARDDVVDLHVDPDREAVAALTRQGLRIWSAGEPAHRWLPDPVGTDALLGCSIAPDGDLLLLRCAEDRVHAYDARSGRLTLAVDRLARWTDVYRLREKRRRAIPGSGIGWSRADRRTVAFRLGGEELPLGEHGFGPDHPELVARGSRASLLRSGGRTYLLERGGALTALEECPGWDAPARAGSLLVRAGDGARRHAALFDAAGRAQLDPADAAGVPPDPAAVTRRPTAVLAWPFAIGGREAPGDPARIVWPGSAVPRTLRDGRFDHDRVRDARASGGTVWLATDHGVVARSTDGAWIADLPGDVDAIGRAGTRCHALAGSQTRPLRLEDGGIEPGDATPGAWVEPIHDGPLLKVRWTPEGPTLAIATAGGGEHAIDPAVLERGSFPWDAYDLACGIPDAGERGRWLVLAGGYAYPCGPDWRVSGPATLLGDREGRPHLLRRAGGRMITYRDDRDAGAWLVRATGLAPGPESHEAVWERIEVPRLVGKWRFLGPDPAGELAASYRFVDGKFHPVGARDGCFDIDYVARLEGNERWTAYLHRAGVGLLDASMSGFATRVAQVHLPEPPADARAWRSAVTRDNRALFWEPGGNGCAVRWKPPGLTVMDAEEVEALAYRQLASWRRGRLIRRGGLLEYVDATFGWDASGEEIFHAGRFSWDHGLRVRGRFLETPVNLQVLHDGRLVAVSSDALRREWEVARDRRDAARLAVPPTELALDGPALRVAGRAAPGFDEDVLDLVEAGSRVWLARPTGVFFVRRDGRWVRRLVREAADWPEAPAGED